MAYWEGLLFGMTLQLAVGPVCFAVLHKSVSRGFKEAFTMVLAVTLVDAGYIAASFAGVGSLLRIEGLRRLVLILGACALFYFGVKYIIKFCKFIRKSNQGEVRSRQQDNGGSPFAGETENRTENSFLYGLKLTAINPLTIVFWSGVFGSLLASEKLSGISEVLFYSAGCISSTLLFLGGVAAGGNLLTGFLGKKGLLWMDLGVGVFLAIFAVRMVIV